MERSTNGEIDKWRDRQMESEKGRTKTHPRKPENQPSPFQIAPRVVGSFLPRGHLKPVFARS
jgi:hypothetical protein